MAGAKRKRELQRAGKQTGRRTKRGLNGHGKPGHGQRQNAETDPDYDATASRYN